MTELDWFSEYDASIIDIIFAHGDSQPDHPALIFDQGDGPIARYSYAELVERVRAMAAALIAQNMAQQRIALLFAPGSDFVIAFLAVLATGGVAVPIAPIGRRRERLQNLMVLINECQPAALMLDSAMTDQYGAELPATLAQESIGVLHFEALADGSGRADPLAVAPTDLAVLQFTSGSTSTPKGVMISHRNIIGNEKMIAHAFGHDRGSDFVGWAPHFHDQGLFGNILQPLYLGSTLILSSPAAFIQKPMHWLQLIDRYRAVTSGGPNFAFDLCLQHVERRGLPEGLDLSSWKAAFNGAEQVRAPSLRRFMEVFAPAGFRPETFLPCFGLAECTLVTIATPHDRPPVIRAFDSDKLSQGLAVPAADPGSPQALDLSCCGPVMAGGEAHIVDPQSFDALPDGSVGEIWIGGPHVAEGYWQRPDATQETFGAHLSDGAGPFLRTGDLGFRDEHGFYIIGRIKDVIILRGRNYAPADVERLWSELTGRVGHVNSAAVQIERDGMEHVVLIAEIARTEIPDHDEDRIQQLARDLRAAAMERLELGVTDLVLVPQSSIPRTTSGKARRVTAGQMLAAGELPAIRIAGPLADSLPLVQKRRDTVTP